MRYFSLWCKLRRHRRGRRDNRLYLATRRTAFYCETCNGG